MKSSRISRDLEDIVGLLAEIGKLPVQTLHRITFCSILNAGLSLYRAEPHHVNELSRLLRGIPLSYRGFVTGKLYLHALRLVKDFEAILKNSWRPVLLKEANLYYIQDLLKRGVGKTDRVLVLDCASIPEIITFAAKFKSSNKHPTILTEMFINPLGVTRFLTQQLKMFDHKTALSGYAKLIENTLAAKTSRTTALIDLTVHRHGVTVENFLNSLNMQAVYDSVKDFSGRDSILITHDHGYDIAADTQGLYVIHGCRNRCPINFSKVALFLVVS